ncbi:MAG: OmpA-OmpF porin, family [Nocardioidaceae bacterium]|nr:OmpA-OmpF porin, family [Nocardioidaceae bacterium]
MDDNRLRGLAGLVGLALVGTVGVGAVVGSNSAADDLRPEAVSALRSAGMSGIAIDFDGREAKLSGGAAADRRKAIAVVEGVNGVRWAKFTGPPSAPPTIPAAPSEPSMTFSRSDVGATISGVVPSAQVAADLKTAAAEAFGGTVSGDFKVDPRVDAADWFYELPEVFGDLVVVRNLKLAIGGGATIQIGGSIESRVGADRAKAIVADAVPDLTVDSTLTVNPGTLDSDDAEVLNSATLYFDRGSSTLSAENRATLDRVVDVLKRNAGINLEAGGHAGPSDPARGMVLSEHRVAAVKAYLLSAGLDSDRISSRSFGSAKKSGGDPFAKRYRRVDFAVEEN